MTRIFLLTQDHPSLIREIATPSIPPFITACLNNVTLQGLSGNNGKLDWCSDLLDIVLQALARILPLHPASFRPFVTRTRSLLNSILAPTPSIELLKGGRDGDLVCPSRLTVLYAQQLYALLPHCAPKNASSDEWGLSVRLVLAQIHRTADCVFRAVIEDSAPPTSNAPGVRAFDEPVFDIIDDALGLSGWRGIHAGMERLSGLLQIMLAHIATKTASSVTLPVGAIIAVTERIFSVTSPSRSAQHGVEVQARLNPEIGREEREGLWCSLPRVHLSAIYLTSVLLARVEYGAISFAQGLLEQLIWLFRREEDRPEIRGAIYEVIIRIVNLIGPSMSKPNVLLMTPVIRAVVNDVLGGGVSTELPKMAVPGKTGASKNPDSYLRPPSTSSEDITTTLGSSHYATELLPLFLSKLPTDHLASSIRSEIDRAAVLTQNKEAMLASVLNVPPIKKNGKEVSSIVPLLAQAHPGSLTVEAVLRPRMPMLQPRQINGAALESDEDEVMVADINDINYGAPKKIPGDSAEAPDTTDQDAKDIAAENDQSSHGDQTTDVPMAQRQKRNPGLPTFPTSPKRGRYEDTSEPSTIPPQLEMNQDEPVGKRIRFEDPEPPDNSANVPQTVTPQPMIPSVLPKLPSAKVIPTRDSWTVKDSDDDDDDGDDDDSDGNFKMPRIILDSDTDEEDGEDEDEEEGEREEEGGQRGETMAG